MTSRVPLPLAGAPLALAIALVATSSTLACHADQQGTGGGNPPPPPAWQLVWHDEFDGAALDTTKWVRETGGDGWGNNELEFYTDRVENARIENGSLVIEARREPFGNQAYTSARLKTQGLSHVQRYGRIEARIKIPRGQGLWPAFWMLGDEHRRAPAGPRAARSTSWRTSARSPAPCTAPCTAPATPGAGGIGGRV